MSPIGPSGSVDCRKCRESIHHYQANELRESARREVQDHLDTCPACARFLHVEEAFLRLLREQLPREVASPELADRVRHGIERDSGAFGALRSDVPYFGRLLMAAALLLLALLVPAVYWSRSGNATVETGSRHIVRAAILVDEDCDRAGRSLEQQRSCRKASHLNALKLADGSYWSLGVDEPIARDLVAEPAHRGRRVVVEGDFYPAIRTFHLTRLLGPRAALPRGLAERVVTARAQEPDRR